MGWDVNWLKSQNPHHWFGVSFYSLLCIYGYEFRNYNDSVGWSLFYTSKWDIFHQEGGLHR